MKQFLALYRKRVITGAVTAGIATGAVFYFLVSATPAQACASENYNFNYNYNYNSNTNANSNSNFNSNSNSNSVTIRQSVSG